MGLLQAVAAAVKVAAAAAAAAVSAASISHPSSPGPDWDEGLLKCPGSPFSPSPPPWQSTARKTLNFRGGAARERARLASPPGERRPPQGACAAALHGVPPVPARSFALAVAAARIFPGLRGAPGIRCGVSSSRPVRSRPFLLSVPESGRGGAKLTIPPVAPPLFHFRSGFGPSLWGGSCSHRSPGGERGPGQADPFRRD